MRWGRFLGRTYPSPGNHDGYENNTNGVPYFDYFGGRSGDRFGGYYSYFMGNWHIVALNSNIAVGVGSPQWNWLRDHLEANGHFRDREVHDGVHRERPYHQPLPLSSRRHPHGAWPEPCLAMRGDVSPFWSAGVGSLAGICRSGAGAV